MEAMTLLLLPWAILGWYLLLQDRKFHKMMKSGRLHKVIRKNIT